MFAQSENCGARETAVAVTSRGADIPDPFRGHGTVNTFPRKRIRMQQPKYCWKRGFLHGLFRDVISKGQSQKVKSVAGYSPDSNDMSTKTEESQLLRSVTGKRLVEAN
jgi:hypothetical protein